MGDQIGKGGLLSGALSRWRRAVAIPHLSGRTLDFGCGRGNLAAVLEPTHYVGVDCDQESLAIARGLHPRHRFSSTIPSGEQFDSVVALAVLEHVRNPQALLETLAGVLDAGGKIVLTTPHPRAERIHAIGAEWRLFSREADEQHEALLDQAAFSALAAEAGLKILRYVPFMLGFNQLIVMDSARR